eukprot:CAMPEP_0177643756 /NCGR_PEP_ID=MMETSP0447-20121125/8318_1 /TAXON_ID=0 /ORGANISM="Stygamoeba regulata, Strain BSH-02190019" /LENGTH=103 /DNA_ID=CAMNT_0019146059 /DNA_START=34 /DNA_END=345 /DNA_ORIENTATION=-
MDKIGPIASLATLVLFVIFTIVVLICVVPNLYWIEQNTSDIEDNTENLNKGGLVPELLLIADGDIKQLHEDLLTTHELLRYAAGLLEKIEANTVPLPAGAPAA